MRQMKKQLHVQYKGDRSYLQGGDLFNALSKFADEMLSGVDVFVEQLSFRRFARTACDVTTELPEDPSSIVGEVRFHQSGKDAVDAWLIETGRPVMGRLPFDEESLLAGSLLDLESQRVSLSERTGHTPIEEAIALTKRLNYAVCPKVNGKWVFAQLMLTERLNADYSQLEIRMKNLIACRFSNNEIYVDDRRIGIMRFIVGDP